MSKPFIVSTSISISDFSKEEIEGAIEKLGKGASVRGEALTLAEFAQLANHFCDLREK